MKQRIHLSLARMSGCEQQFIQEAFDTNWVVPLGPNVNAFEKDLETFIGQGRHIVALSSGTAAIHLGLLQLGLQNRASILFLMAVSCRSAMLTSAFPIVQSCGSGSTASSQDLAYGTVKLAAM